MKRLHITMLFAITFSLTLFANDIIGDVNSDGKVGMDDALCLVKFFLGNSENIETSAADVNNDGVVTIADANAIVNMNVQKTMKRDTITILYCEDSNPIIYNPATNYMQIDNTGSNANDITVLIKDTTTTAIPFISLKGRCSDGRLRIDSDVDYTLLLNGVNLTSSHAPAFNSTKKGKVNVILTDGTTNNFTDAKKYVFTDTLETANGCFSCYGPIALSGNGTLKLQGKYSHALYCKKSITVNGGDIVVNDAKSDALHSGKNITINGGQLTLKGMKSDAIDLDDDFIMTGGTIDMDITGEAAKGIKCSGIMNISNGKITATASGALKNSKGDLSYCTILKCDSNAVISGGNLALVNNTPGGKCISVGRNLTISGGVMNLETHGDGAEYTNTDGETDYYTSKCIATDDSLFIHRGNIQCLSTGIGGKGIVGDKYIEIGMPTDTQIEQGPTINIETTNCSIVNDVEEDQRYGCPKALKASAYLNIYSGDIHCMTAGMGGEGIECGKEFYFYNGNLECYCFDDGINVGEKIEVLGGQIYCNSEDNDGIDSNGSIYIKGGIIASVNKTRPNESFDTENSQLYITGGTAIGIGSSQVKIKDCGLVYYNSIRNLEPKEGPMLNGLTLTKDKYICVLRGSELLLSLYNENQEYRSYITIVSDTLQKDLSYGIIEGNKPIEYKKALFGGKLIFGGNTNDCHEILKFRNNNNIIYE